jgi:signal transduction histidine kinase
VAGISGANNAWRRFIARIKRYDATIVAMVAAAAFISGISWASRDLLRATRSTDDQLQTTGLRGQLVEFLLMSTRELDGSSLLDNPEDFSLSKRTLKVVTVRKPFFSYFLTKGNVKSFNKELIRTEQPRSCVLEYPVDIEVTQQQSPRTVQVCIAAVKNDPAGHYLYAIIKYPTDKVIPHRRGQPLKNSDLITLKFQSENSSPTIIRIALEELSLAQNVKKRAPARFDGLYELASFLNEDGTQPTSLVNGQAIERIEQPDGVRVVTISLRIDAAVLNQRIDMNVWPLPQTKAMSIGLDIRRSGSSRIVIPETLRGTAQTSIEQAYLTAVSSHANLNIYQGNAQYWSSKSLETGDSSTKPALVQQLGAKLADMLKGEPIEVRQNIQSQNAGTLTAELSSSGNVLPDIAARILAWLTLAVVFFVIFAVMLVHAMSRLGIITRDALTLAKAPHKDAVEKYAGKKDQIGTLGRIIYKLHRRTRGYAERKTRALAREEQALHQHQLSLKFISHEIRSPIATLLTLNPEGSENHRLLQRIQRAMEIFKETRDIDQVIEEGALSIRVHDLSLSLSAYVQGLSSDECPVRYEGPQTQVKAKYDDVLLDQVLQNVIDNACRYVTEGTFIEVRMVAHNVDAIRFEIFNQGPNAENIDNLFVSGYSESNDDGNLGLGLYAAKKYIEGFGGEIYAENRDNGFAIVILLLSA